MTKGKEDMRERGGENKKEGENVRRERGGYSVHVCVYDIGTVCLIW